MADKPLKSAYELAMERLRARDREEGIESDRPLREEQKQEIGRIRQEAKAKLAELEIFRRDALRDAAGDPEKIREIEEKHAVDRERVESRTEAAVARVRNR